MSGTAIRVEGLSKRFTLGAARRARLGLRDHMAEGLRELWRSGWRRPKPEIIWALKDVSFEVKRGELVGLVGRNGAGKSTLLKILSRISEPTAGRVELFGSVASLLEVGTGFHPELSGRENIYLNGAILGMKKAEIERKFDEIIAFAEIDRFIDTPVKRYSSGMYVRLGFAVAAHLETQILIVDEVLAVGDAAFQRKCLGTMQEVATQGRTVILVTHNTGMINQLCTRCLFVDGGTIRGDGPPEIVVTAYLNQYSPTAALTQDGTLRPDRGDGIYLRASGAQRELLVRCGDPVALEFDVESTEPLSDPSLGVTILNPMGTPAISMAMRVQGVKSPPGTSRCWKVRCDLGALPLNPGNHSVNVQVLGARFSGAFTIRVSEHDVFGSGQAVPRVATWGPLHWAPHWELRPGE